MEASALKEKGVRKAQNPLFSSFHSLSPSPLLAPHIKTTIWFIVSILKVFCFSHKFLFFCQKNKQRIVTLVNEDEPLSIHLPSQFFQFLNFFLGVIGPFAFLEELVRDGLTPERGNVQSYVEKTFG